MRDDKKAFLLSDSPIREENWSSIRLNCGKYLSWGKDLRVAYSDDHRIALIGECWSIQKGMKPQEQIHTHYEHPAEELLALEQYWDGRYLLIIDGSIYMDMCGLLCLFYNERYCSNDLNLILELEKLSCRKELIRHGLLPDFVPGALTQYKGIYRLLPSQTYDFMHHQCGIRPMFNEMDRIDDKEELTRVFIEAFDACFQNMAEHFKGKKLLLALTGGRDSRTVLALMKHAGISFETYLLLFDSVADADAALCEQLSDCLRIKSHFISPKKENYSRKRVREFDQFTAHYDVDADRLFYAYGQYTQLKEQFDSDIVIIRGAVWGTAIEYFGLNDWEGIDTVFPMLKYNKAYRDSVQQWKDNVVMKDRVNQGLSMSNRLYWDIRAGCWLSTMERSFDLYDGITSVQPMNCRYLMGRLLMYEKAERMEKKHEEYIVSQACPEIAEIPYDYQIAKTTHESWTRYIIMLDKALWIARTFGIPSMMEYIGDWTKKASRKKKNGSSG